MKLSSFHIKDIKCLLFATILSMFFLSTTQVHGSWSTGGPYGGYINCMALAPNPDVIYAGTEGGVFKTVDGRDTWTVTAFHQIPVRAIQVAPAGLCQTINFDDAAAPCSFSETTALSNEYDSQGVIFSGPGGNDGGAILDRCSSSGPDGQSLPNYLAFDTYETLSDGGVPQWPETITFTQSTSFVKVSATRTVSNVTMTAYDASENLIDSDSLKPVFWAFTPISVAGADIAKVVIDVTDPSGTPFPSLLLDDLAFTRQPAGPQPDVVYAGTDDGIYKSEDGGATWILTGLSGTRVDAIAVHPANPCLVYAGTNGSTVGIFKSADGGHTWQEKLSEELDEVRALLTDADNPEHIYAGIRNSYRSDNFCKSTNGGENWVCGRVGRISTPPVISLAMTPSGSDPAAIYAVVDSWDVHKSTDGGDTWESIAASKIADLHPQVISVDPIDTDVLYLGNGYSRSTHENLYKSKDGGETWSPKTNALPQGAPSDILVDPRNSDIYVGFPESGIHKSTDGAESWIMLALNQTRIEGLAVSPTDSGTAFAAVAGWGTPHLARTTNGGLMWDYLNASPTDLGAVTLDVSNASTMFVGSAQGFFYRSADSGTTWNETKYFDGRPIKDIWINPSNPNIVLVAAEQYISYDYIYYGGVFRNSDGGTTSTWNFRYKFWRPTCLAADPTNHQVVYLGVKDSGYVIRSDDGGISWNNISPSSEWVDAVYDIDVGSTSEVYAATSDGIWAWDNVGWSKLGHLPSDVCALAIDRSTSPDTIYAGTKENGVFVSCDRGNTWIPFNKGLGSLSISKLAISSGQPKMLYAGTMNGGVWSSAIQPDRDNDGLPDDLEGQMCTDPNDPDTDDDGLLDGVEDANQNGAVDTDETDPCKADTDEDGMSDGWEVNNSLDPLSNDSTGDVDIDLLNNIGEFANKTDPNNPDTDADKMPDGWEVVNNLNPLVDDAQADADGDGYSNLEEYQRQTDPNDSNSHPIKAMPWLPLLLDEDGP